MSEEILKTYNDKSALLDAFRQKMEALILELIADSRLNVHSVTSRLKTRDSLAEKLQRDGKLYQSFDEITDVVGLRVITYFDDEVDKIAQIIRREFEVDENRSIDKRNHDLDRFGYSSLHFICSIASKRLAFAEYGRFGGAVFELQVRSILQHAWAEIEHDIGYKSATGLRNDLQRRLFRVAGLLEIADSEFRQIRDEKQAYEAEVAQQVGSADGENLNGNLDSVTISAFIVDDNGLRQLENGIASEIGIVRDETASASAQNFLQAAETIGILTLDQLRQRLESRRSGITASVRAVLKEFSNGPVKKLGAGFAISHLAMLLMSEQGTDNFKNFLKRLGYPDPVVEQLVNLYLELAKGQADSQTSIPAG